MEALQSTWNLQLFCQSTLMIHNHIKSKVSFPDELGYSRIPQIFLLVLSIHDPILCHTHFNRTFFPVILHFLPYLALCLFHFVSSYCSFQIKWHSRFFHCFFQLLYYFFICLSQSPTSQQLGRCTQFLWHHNGMAKYYQLTLSFS